MSPSIVTDDDLMPSAELELPPPDPPELLELPLELPPPQAASTHAAAVATAAVVRRALFMRSSSMSSRAIARIGNSGAGPPDVPEYPGKTGMTVRARTCGTAAYDRHAVFLGAKPYVKPSGRTRS